MFSPLQALVAWGRDTIVVAFRGTASLENVLHDLQVLTRLWVLPTRLWVLQLTCFVHSLVRWRALQMPVAGMESSIP